ncbi:endonuclease/exonuclease/phosphatase family protein [Magnetospira sp. QH-2]|uniref:endonuclease/exonuclease/phosphatase family protein n=1 Tax=Magnetospira sp. (strain QH-2) TaxID=1288970 RepID=UPI0003E8175B|nr:endonuclease/exonuclease/phosphatase family protein [Magnetospira sp. QH-2]CCQ75776.1 Conserved exported protein of unknown function [Magnetospira sp. QH-2]
MSARAATVAGFCFLAFLTLADKSAAEASVHRLATWNTQNLRADRPDRKDIPALRAYAARLNADIVALQETDGPNSAALLFSPDVYDYHFSGRRHPQRTGFAIRKGVPWTPLPDLNFLNVDETGAPGHVRHGAAIQVRGLTLVSIHLKSGCWGGRLSRANRSCQILARQLRFLAAWTAAREGEGRPVVLLGDFNRRLNAPSGDGRAILTAAVPGLIFTTDQDRNQQSDCWSHAPRPARHYPAYIDHIVIGPLAAPRLKPGSFAQVLFDPGLAHKYPFLSDHCAIGISVLVPAPGQP